MAELIQQLNPMSGFIVSEGAKLTDYDQAIITALYQPIIGPDATVLLSTLWNLLVDQPMISERMRHLDLLNIVNLSPQAVVVARGRLEALNLMQTWHNTDTLGEYYIYEMHAPLLPQQFFMDELMSVLLLTAVGPNYYQSLQARFQLRQLSQINGTDISQKITDVFNINSEAFKTVKQVAVPEKQRNQRAKLELDSVINVNPATFDFDLLFDSLANTGITQANLATKRNLCYTLHQTFGINELELAQVIRQTMTFDTNEIDSEQLKQRVVAMYANPNGSSKELGTETKTEISVSEQSGDPEAEAYKHLKPQVKVAVRDMKELKPLEMLQSIKTKNNGYPASNEIKTVTDVVATNVIPIEVVNSLIFYVLVTLKHDNLNRMFFNSIANTLGRNHITGAIAALRFLSEYKRKKDEKGTNSFNKSARKKIESPLSYKKPQTPTVSAADLAATKERIAQLKAKRIQQQGDQV